MQEVAAEPTAAWRFHRSIPPEWFMQNWREGTEEEVDVDEGAKIPTSVLRKQLAGKKSQGRLESSLSTSVQRENQHTQKRKTEAEKWAGNHEPLWELMKMKTTSQLMSSQSVTRTTTVLQQLCPCVFTLCVCLMRRSWEDEEGHERVWMWLIKEPESADLPTAY